MTFVIKRSPVWKRLSCCWISCGIRQAGIALGWTKMFCAVTFLALQITCLLKDWLPQVINDIVMYSSKGIYTKVPLEMQIFSVTENSMCVLLLALFLFGIHSNKPWLMVPYLIMELIMMATLIIVIVVVSSINMAIMNHGLGVAVFLAGTFIIGVLIFLWEIFYNCYRYLNVQHYLLKSLYKVEIAHLTYN